MKSSKKTVISVVIIIDLAFVCIFNIGCQSTSVNSLSNTDAFDLTAQSVKGSSSSFHYETESKVTVLEKGKLIRKYVDSANFEIERRTINVNDKGDIQFQITTDKKTGNVELKDLGYPEPGQELFEMIDKFGKPLVVKDMPIGSIFYIARVALPKTPVKKNETWTYRARWISDDTGWPFEIIINSKLKSTSECDGLVCAIVTFEGEVILPEDFPLKGKLTSKISGEYHYAPISYEVLWGVSESDEDFNINEISKQIKVKSRSCSYKIGYNKGC